ncbi:MAG: hypothetical protein IJA67_10460 [Oscillospiraceae bacterium]|nr:hypothetical protein [Oscillospiraceae bacterium]
MARQRNPNRDKAKQMWLKANGEIKLKDIAAKLGESESTIRKWKSEEKWQGVLEEKQARKEAKRNRNAPNEKSEPKRSGAPLGNRNAVGNVGGGAPQGNTNALKHGGYSSIFWDTLSEREKEMIDSMDQTVEQQLLEEIKLLTVREHRILHNLQKYRDLLDSGEHLVKSGTSRKEVLRDFDTEEDREKFAELARKAEERGDKLPGNEYELTTKREATIDLIHRLEDALTRCQNEKRRCLDSLHKVQSEKTVGQELKSNNLIEALFANTKEDFDISDIPELIEAAEADDDLVELSEV